MLPNTYSYLNVFAMLSADFLRLSLKANDNLPDLPIVAPETVPNLKEEPGQSAETVGELARQPRT